MPKFVYATGSQMVGTPDGGWYRVNGGDIYDAEDKVVRAAPHLFTEDFASVAVSSEPRRPQEDAPVEQATAAPGERRAQIKSRG